MGSAAASYIDLASLLTDAGWALAGERSGVCA